MKKVPVTDSDEKKGDQRSTSSAPGTEQAEGVDEMASMQADLDRFRDLAMRSQADFENYKKRCAREKEEAIKYANRSLLEKLVSVTGLKIACVARRQLLSRAARQNNCSDSLSDGDDKEARLLRSPRGDAERPRGRSEARLSQARGKISSR